MSNISRYADQVLHDVRDYLWTVKENGGLATKSVREAKYAEYARESGRGRAIDIINIAYQAMGKNAIIAQESDATPQQIASLVERAKYDSRDILAEIKALREQKEKKMNSAATPPEEVTIHRVFTDEEDAEDLEAMEDFMANVFPEADRTQEPALMNIYQFGGW